MSDGDGNIIPHVEEDQGEGIKDFIDEHMSNTDKLNEKLGGDWRDHSLSIPAVTPIQIQLDRVESKVNRILIHLGIDDKSEILKI